MIKKLVTIGCSWTYGDELLDPALKDKEDCNSKQNMPYRLSYGWPGLIAKHYNLELDNQSFPGASLVSMRDAMTWYVTNNDISNTLFIIGLTETWRWSWHDIDQKPQTSISPEWNTHAHSIWIQSDPGNYSSLWNQTFKSYITDQLCDELQKKNLEQTLLFFDGIAARFNVPMLQFNMLNTIPDVIKLPTYIWQEENIRDWLGNKDVLAIGGHPNELGHKKISERLINYIDSAKIIEC